MKEYLMEAIEKAVKDQIKKLSEEHPTDFKPYLKGLKILNVSQKEVKSDIALTYSEKGTLMKLNAKFKFTAKKYDHNIIDYIVNIYSDGSMDVHYNGDHYEA